MKRLIGLIRCSGALPHIIRATLIKSISIRTNRQWIQPHLTAAHGGFNTETCLWMSGRCIFNVLLRMKLPAAWNKENNQLCNIEIMSRAEGRQCVPDEEFYSEIYNLYAASSEKLSNRFFLCLLGIGAVLTDLLQLQNRSCTLKLSYRVKWKSLMSLGLKG